MAQLFLTDQHNAYAAENQNLVLLCFYSLLSFLLYAYAVYNNVYLTDDAAVVLLSSYVPFLNAKGACVSHHQVYTGQCFVYRYQASKTNIHLHLVLGFFQGDWSNADKLERCYLDIEDYQQKG